MEHRDDVPRPRGAEWEIFRGGAGAALSAAVACAAIVRLGAARGSLWLDEIWSLEIARQLPSWTGIFTVARHDNNHFLNTLVLRLAGGDASPVACRVHSVLAGVAFVLLAATFAGRWGARAALLAASVTAGSYFPVNYASEARGYAMAGAFALACFLLLERWLERGRLLAALGFSLCAILGLLSHLTFLHAYVALVVWSVVRAARPWRGAREALGALLLPHLLPGLALAMLYGVSLRGMTVGGGGEPGVTSVGAVVQAASLLVGGPLTGPGRYFGASIAAVLLAAAAGAAWSRRSEAMGFLLLASLVVPSLLAPFLGPGFLYPRYFFVAGSLAMVAIAIALDSTVGRGGGLRWIAVMVLAAMAAGNAWHLLALLRVGRGDPDAAVRFVAKESVSARATVTGDHPIRVGFVFDHLARKIGQADRLIYFDAEKAPAGGTDWFILHSPDPGKVPDVEGRDAAGHRYTLARSFPHSGISGQTWFVYRRAPEGPAAAGGT